MLHGFLNLSKIQKIHDTFAINEKRKAHINAQYVLAGTQLEILLAFG